MLRNIFLAVLITAWSNVALAFDLNVTAGAQNQVVSGSTSYTIPQGTNKVFLVYNIYSAEYPSYVTAQSIYNDVWSLSVAGSSGVLFDITRQVNSQLTQDPVWLSDSTTGDIKKEIDVSALTMKADANIQVAASSMNVGDGALTTIVRAKLETTPSLLIEDAAADSITTTNAGNYYSIPRPHETNSLQRYYTLTLSKGENVNVENVTVKLLENGELMTILDSAAVPASPDVTIVSQTSTSMKLKVRITMRDPASTVNSVPPPARDISYRFKVEGVDANGVDVEDSRTITGRRALWRMPDIFDGFRYGSRDTGGDDWVARGTYTWMETNSALINEVDDVSGEHGRNIGHSTHQYGTDIDNYHFYRFPGGTSGTDNYYRLRNAVVSAFGALQANPTPASITARDQVITWITETRNGLEALANLNTVSRLYYAIGSASNGLPNGWARSLITTGRVTRTANGVITTLDLGQGNWASGKVAYNSVHNNHVHITLDRPAIGE